MRVRNSNRWGKEKNELLLTAMIDVVFLLLIFFIMTFQIVAPEGDLNVKMPRAAGPENAQVPQFLPIKVRLRADGNGQLAGIRMGQRTLENLGELRMHMREMVGDGRGLATPADAAEVELDCDYNLKFEHAVGAITAVSGYVDEGQIVRLVGKIRFAPPRPGQ